MPIPYMGSKRKSAQKIYQTIVNFNPKANTLIDLFCGGFAIGEIFLHNGFSVIANDKNKYVIALLKEAIKGVDEVKCFEFVKREKFNDVIINCDNYPDWYVGYVMFIWSFGNNNKKGYLFGKDTEPYKLAGHELVVNKNANLLKQLLPTIPQKYIDGVLKQKDWHTRRIAFGRVAKTLKNRIFELHQLERLERLQQLERLESLERLQQLESLERLQQLQQLERLQIFTKSYDQIEIIKDAIVYCDPPYKGTEEYTQGNFDHDKFWQWVRTISKTNKVYISEYTAPDDFEALLEFSQKSTLQGGQQKHSNQPNEKLFILRGQEK